MLSQDRIEELVPGSETEHVSGQRSAEGLLSTLQQSDMQLLLWLNGLSNQQVVATFFRIISRMGDGVFWYSMMAVFVYQQAYMAVSHMAIAGLVGLFIYKSMKSYAIRPRPFVTNPAVRLRGKPLDEYSFPSGHTLHAVSFSIVATYYYPPLGIYLLPITLLVAASRCVLGLHYPSDVIAGATMAPTLAPAITSLG